MTESLLNAVLAVDGGGTRCRVACEIAGQVHSVETGAANVSTDFDGAVGQIKAGFQQLAGKLGVSPSELPKLPACIGLAGVTDRSIADRLRSALGLQRARIEDDRPTALRGALGAQDGVIAHCGTGSFVALQIGGEVRLAGGWGPVLGDEASAQSVARLALSGALKAQDGSESDSDLARKLRHDLGGSAGVVEFAGSASPSEFGALAPIVTSAAADGDELARKVMIIGADYIVSTATSLGWRPGLVVCLTGGIGPQYASYLPSNMQADLTPPQGEPLAGALALAKEVADEHH